MTSAVHQNYEVPHCSKLSFLKTETSKEMWFFYRDQLSSQKWKIFVSIDPQDSSEYQSLRLPATSCPDETARIRHLQWHGACLTLLLPCFFLLTEGDPGCPGLGTELEPADVGPEWAWDPFSTTDDMTSGDCWRETFCSSAANCLGSTPGDFALSTRRKQRRYVLGLICQMHCDACWSSRWWLSTI